ncbi:MAG: NADH-quinone oxidoreductase subunit J [Phycisphaerales bacterium]|nr:NADH-quinone oxidoreductase subunit J [Phycisphaerales bacterium]
MEQFIHPLVLYAACALGALGVYLALPRRNKSLHVVGGLIAAIAGGIAILGLTLASVKDHPSIYFYIFAVVALGGALRVVTHPRPVYAALFFILTVIATAGLFLLLSAEFMAFALIIVYAGAILITYLFVIMLATQAPTEDEYEGLAEYDLQGREPLAATVVGFVLLAALSTMVFRGVGQVDASHATRNTDQAMAIMPGRVETLLRREGVLQPGERIAQDQATGRFLIDPVARTVTLASGTDSNRTIPWPASLGVRNVEGLGVTLIGRHPGTIEIAGVILLMAMLGAVVLSRKQVQVDEAEKGRQVRTLAQSLAQSTADARSVGRGGTA